MKKLLLFFLMVIASYTIKAQNMEVSGMPNKPYNQTIDSLFSNVNKTAVTSGVWYDRASPMANLNSFNQFAADTTANYVFGQAYFQLYHATYSNANLVNPDDFDGIVRHYSSQDKVPLGLINYTYQYLDTNALANNLIYQSNGLYYDTPNRPSSPWRTKQFVMGAVLADSLVDNGSGVNFYMAEAFFLQNGSKTISTIQIDFNDGSGLRTITQGATVNTGYNSDGIKTVKFMLTFNDNSQQITYASFKYKLEYAVAYRLTCPNRIKEIKRFQSTLTFQGYTETAARKGRGDVTIFYHDSPNCDTVLRKPIIVIDGFDPGSERTAYYAIKKSNTLYNQMVFTDNLGNKNNLVDSLNILGYDVVVLDFPRYKIGNKTINIPFSSFSITIPITLDGGADYIERNAYVLVHLIDSLNAKLVQNGISEQLVIIGPSMGGLISRYALAYMENNNMAHNTRLWVSFDAPHWGANIPLGDQLYINYFADLSKGAKLSRNEKLASTAAKQMLRTHYTVLENQQALTGAVGFRNRFQTALDDMGWPTNLRKIALVNGSINGITTNTPCDIALQSETRLTAWFVYSLRAARGKVRFMPAAGGGWCEVFKGSHAPFDDSSVKVGTNSNYLGSLDTAPGALFDTQLVIAKEGQGTVTTNTWIKQYYKTRFANVRPVHSFISTISSLAITNGLTQNLLQDLSNRNLVTTGETPFDSYFAPSVNEPHITLTACNVDYILKEINGIPQSPIGDLYSISGPDTLCTSAPYSVSGLPNGATVFWSTTGKVNISHPDDTSPNVYRTGFGATKLIATITTGTACGNVIVNKNIIAVGNTQTGEDPFINGPDTLCSASNYVLENPLWGGSVSWTASGGVSITATSINPNFIYISKNNTGLDYGSVTANVNTSCGTYSFVKNIAVDPLPPEPWENAGFVENELSPYATGDYYDIWPGHAYYNVSSRYVTVTVGANQYSGDYIWSDFEVSNAYSSTNITWTHPNNDKRQLLIDFGVTPPYGATFSFYMGGNGLCRAVGETIYFEMADDGDYNGYQTSYSYSYSPNPANNELTVERTENKTYQKSVNKSVKTEQQAKSSKKSSKKSAPLEAILYNQSGKVVAKGSGTTKATMNTAALANGTYFLHYKDEKGKLVKKQIIVQH